MPRKSKGELFRSPHKLALDTPRAVRIEMSRLYRGGLNGRVKPVEMTRFTYTLEKILRCLETEAAAEAAQAAAQAAEGNGACALPSIRIITVDSGQFFSDDQLREMPGLGPLDPQRTIEHSPSPALRELEGEIAEARAGVHEPIVEPPLIRAPANVREGAISHGLHLVKTSREVLEDRLAALPDATLRALAGVTGDEEG